MTIEFDTDELSETPLNQRFTVTPLRFISSEEWQPSEPPRRLELSSH